MPVSTSPTVALQRSFRSSTKRDKNAKTTGIPMFCSTISRRFDKKDALLCWWRCLGLCHRYKYH